jgi:hypothetical protein
MISRLAGGPPPLAVIAGERDTDAETRVRLRASLPASPSVTRWSMPPQSLLGVSGTCLLCLTGAQAERDAVAEYVCCAALGRVPDQPQAELCPAHLQEACSGPERGAHPAGVAGEALALHARQSIPWLTGLAAPGRPHSAFRPFAGRRRGPRRGPASRQCPACHAWQDAASATAARLTETFRDTSLSATACSPALCLRHVMAVRRQDPGGAAAAILLAASSAEALVAELKEAFRKRSWAHRNEDRGRR